VLATIAAWLASQGASLLLGAGVKLLTDLWNSYQANKAQQDLATAQAQLGQATTTIAAQQAELQAQADAPKDADDAIKRLEEGSA